jgi:hypothetical protein
MATKNTKDIYGPGNDIITRKTTYNQKVANNKQWVKQYTDLLDVTDTRNRDPEVMAKYDLNYDLWNGRYDPSNRKHASTLYQYDEDGGPDAAYDEIPHQDILSIVAKGIFGEQKKRDLSPMAIDESSHNYIDKKRKQLELIKEAMNNTIINPLTQEIEAQVMQQMGIEDPFQLPPEQQEELNAEIQNQVQLNTPKEIKQYMETEYMSLSEIQSQELLDFCMSEYNLKWFTDENMKHLILTGVEAFGVRIFDNNNLVPILCNPKGLDFDLAPGKHFIEESEWIKYEQSIKYSDVFTYFGEQMKPKDIKRLEHLYGYATTTSKGGIFHGDGESALIHKISSTFGDSISAIDPRTNEGQSQWIDIINRSFGGGMLDVRHLHVCYKALRLYKKIKRIDKNTGELKIFYTDEFYEYNPLKGDIEVQAVWLPQIWECDKIGSGSGDDALYFNMRPFPFQYRNIHNPRHITMPYIGSTYSRTFGISKNVAPIDLAKPYQERYNITMNSIDRDQANDIGKVLALVKAYKPKDMKLTEWMKMMKYGKVALLDTNSETTRGVDPQLFKTLDFSTLDKLAPKIEYLNYLENKAAIAMCYNTSRLGQASPYTTVTNNQQNIVQSTHQTEDLFSIHGMVVENFLNYIVRAAKFAFRGDPIQSSKVLSDGSKLDIELNWDILDNADIGVRIRNSSEDFENLNRMKMHLDNMFQNQVLNFAEYSQALYATNGSKLQLIAEQADMRRKQEIEEERRAQAEEMEKQRQAAAEAQEKELEFEKYKFDVEIETKRYYAELETMKFANQMDINKDGQNDMIERTILELESKEKIKDQELKHKEMLEKMKIESNERIAKITSRARKTNR